MIRQYFKQAWVLLRQERLFSSIYIVGTGLAVSMLMAVVIALTVLLSDASPENNRDRMLIVDFGKLECKDGGMTQASLSTQTIHRCFDGMDQVEALAMSSTRIGWVQQPEGRGQFETLVKGVNDGFWKVFDFRFVSGGPFADADFRSGVAVAVVSEHVARKVFGTTDVVGRELSLDFVKYRISGVVRDVSALMTLTCADLWVSSAALSPMPGLEDDFDETGTLGEYGAVMLVRPDADLDLVAQDARERIGRYARSLGEEYKFSCGRQPDTFLESVFQANRNESSSFAGGIYPMVMALIFVLLIVPAVNLAGMTDSRMERRMAELGVRRAFGAPKQALFRQVIIENLLFTLLGSVFGLAAAYLFIVFGGDWLFRILLETELPSEGRIFFEPSMFFKPVIIVLVLLVTFLLNLFSAILPAWRASRRPIVESLSPMGCAGIIGGQGMSFFTRLRRNAWIGSELMLVFCLLWLATEFFIMLGFSFTSDTRFDLERVWSITPGSLSPQHREYDSLAAGQSEQRADFERMFKRLREYGDFDRVSVIQPLGSPYNGYTVWYDLRNGTDTTRYTPVQMMEVYPGSEFFEMFGVRMADGSPARMEALGLTDRKSVVLSEKAARRIFPEGDAVGRTIRLHKTDMRVTGVVEDVKTSDYERTNPLCFLGADIRIDDFEDMPSFAVHLKEGVSERDFADRFMAEMSPRLNFGNLYLKEVKPYRQFRHESSAGYVMGIKCGVVMTAFFLLNVLLCVIGTFWYRVRLRRDEIGLRMAMGADSRRIRRMLVGEGMALLAVAALGAVFLEIQLILSECVYYGLPWNVPAPEAFLDHAPLRFLITNLITWGILALTTFAGIMFPAGRAAKMSPADALHDE